MSNNFPSQFQFQILSGEPVSGLFASKKVKMGMELSSCSKR